jgi:hypothetical protein
MLHQPAATGTLQGVREGDHVRWKGVVDVKEAGCQAMLDVPMQLANHGVDLLGDGTVQGTCTQGRVEPAAFSLRRR